MSNIISIITDFKIVDNAVWAFLRRSATHTRQVLTDGEYTIYWIFPDDRNQEERLGIIEVRRLPGGVNLEYGGAFVKEEWKWELTDEEWKAERAAFQAAVARHKPDNFSADDNEQYTALDTAVKNDEHYRPVKEEIENRIKRERSERYAAYETKMQRIINELQAWFDEQGITGDRAGNDLPALPNTKENQVPKHRYEAWKKAWLKMRVWANSDTPVSQIAKNMRQHHPELKASDRSTVSKIIKAGKAGHFD